MALTFSLAGNSCLTGSYCTGERAQPVCLEGLEAAPTRRALVVLMSPLACTHQPDPQAAIQHLPLQACGAQKRRWHRWCLISWWACGPAAEECRKSAAAPPTSTGKATVAPGARPFQSAAAPSSAATVRTVPRMPLCRGCALCSGMQLPAVTAVLRGTHRAKAASSAHLYLGGPVPRA